MTAFEPQYDEREHTWTTLRGLGDILLLNCAQCDVTVGLKA